MTLHDIPARRARKTASHTAFSVAIEAPVNVEVCLGDRRPSSAFQPNPRLADA